METAIVVNQHKLVEEHRSFAHAVAAEVLRKLPKDVDRDDIRAAAELGLVEAANHFDPARGVLFKTFAYYRIRGAVYDCLRKMGWLPSRLYRECKFEMAANAFLADCTGSPASGGGNADHQQIRGLAGSIVSCFVLSLDAVGDELLTARDTSPEQNAAASERKALVEQALRQLPDRNRRVIEGHYFREQSLDQIGRELGLSKSWVSRIHARSIEMLHGALAAMSSHARLAASTR
jgi:RNA polymerase sigma factor for flagellar operon FliA